MWELNHQEGWAPKNDAFELWCWRRLFRVPWPARSNQSILNENNPEYSLGRTDAETESSNTLATQCKELIHWKIPWWWERLRAGEERGNRGWNGWMASLTHWTWVWANSGRWWSTGNLVVPQSTRSQRIGHNWATEQQPLYFNYLLQPTLTLEFCFHAAFHSKASTFFFAVYLVLSKWKPYNDLSHTPPSCNSCKYLL